MIVLMREGRVGDELEEFLGLLEAEAVDQELFMLGAGSSGVTRR